MRVRLSICTAVAVLGGALPATASAAHTLSLHLTPTTVPSRDDVKAFGKLTGSPHGNRIVYLFTGPITTLLPVGRTRLCPLLAPGSTVASVKTAADGTWSTTINGTITSTSAYVVAATQLPDSANLDCSVIVSKPKTFRAQAILTVAAPPTSATTDTKVSFGVDISPGTAHPHQRLTLQRHSHGQWVNVTTAKTNASGHATFKATFVEPGVKTLRVHFAGDDSNVAASSDSFEIAVDQKQNPDLTINPDTHVVDTGANVIVTGTLSGAGNAGRLVQLVGQDVTGFHTLQFLTTDPNGNFAFSTGPLAHTTSLVVEVSDTPSRKSSEAHVIARSLVTLTGVSAPHTVAQVGDAVRFEGTVTPNRHGDEIRLERKGSGGRWHAIATAHVKSDGTYAIVHQFVKAGSLALRIVIPGDGDDGRGATAEFAGTVDP